MEKIADRCPKCKGTTGYNYTYWTKYNAWISWGGSEQSCDSSDSKESKLAECLDCGYRFRFSTYQNKQLIKDALQIAKKKLQK